MATTDVERLLAQLSADVKGFERGMARAQGIANRQFTAIERRARQMDNRLNAVFAGVQARFLGIFAGAASIAGAQQLIDTATRIENALKVAGLAGAELDAVYGDLLQSAQRNYAPLESLVNLYSRVALVQDELGVSSQDLIKFTDTVALALRVAGTDAQAASGALTQLSQSLGSGVVRAEEFNSILEGAPTILRAAAAGIKEADGSVAQLRKIMLDGELSSRALFDGIAAGAVVLQDAVKDAETTSSQRFENLRTALADTAGKFDELTDASGFFGNKIDQLAGLVTALGDVIDDLANNSLFNLAGQIYETINPINELLEKIGGIANLPAFLGTVNNVVQDRVRGITPEDRRIQNRIGDAFAPGQTTPKTGRATIDRAPVTVPEEDQISINNPLYKAEASGKGSGRKSARERADEYQRLAERIREATAATQAETAALATLNPLIDDYGFTLERARAKQELLTAAQQAGKVITPELSAEIDRLATSYAQATVDAAKLGETQDRIREKAEEMRDFQKDLSRSIVDGFVEGKNAADIFADALQRVSTKLLDMAFEGLFDSRGSSSGNAGGGLFGAIKGLIGLSGGGYTGPGGKYTPKGIVHGGEYVFSKEATNRIGPANLEAMHRAAKGFANGGYVAPRMPALASRGGAAQGGLQITYAPQIDARGADSAAIARLEAQMAKDKAEFPYRVQRAVAEGRATRAIR
jgi:tape measure domain-containing protein